MRTLKFQFSKSHRRIRLRCNKCSRLPVLLIHHQLVPSEIHSWLFGFETPMFVRSKTGMFSWKMQYLYQIMFGPCWVLSELNINRKNWFWSKVRLLSKLGPSIIEADLITKWMGNVNLIICIVNTAASYAKTHVWVMAFNTERLSVRIEKSLTLEWYHWNCG